WINTYAVTDIRCLRPRPSVFRRETTSPPYGNFLARATAADRGVRHGRRRDEPGRSGKSAFEGGELVAQLLGETLAELVEVRADARELGAPLVEVDVQRRVDPLTRLAEAVEHEVVGGRDDADGGDRAGVVALEAPADPLEHARVLAEAGPQELAV